MDVGSEFAHRMSLPSQPILLPCIQVVDALVDAPAVNPTTPHVEARTSNDFSPSAQFMGARAGYVFKLGAYGLGYYADTAAATAHPLDSHVHAIATTPAQQRLVEKIAASAAVIASSIPAPTPAYDKSSFIDELD